jgi:protein dithiol oxidoreductase (disulfide-forming)
MKKLPLLLGVVAALAVLAGCGSKEPGTTVTPAETAMPAAAGTSAADAPAATQEALQKAAAATQESTGTETDAGDASLERIAAMPANMQLPAGKWVAGTHYKPVVPAQPTTAGPGQVEVVEIFWLGCSHCYALEPFIQGWKKSKASYIKFVQIPVMWGAAHRAHARFYYTLEALGKADSLVPKAFDTIHKGGNMLLANDDATTQRMHLDFAKANGIGEADFKREYNGFAVNAKLQYAEEQTRRYKVEGVPLVIINGKYETDVGMAGSHEKLIQLINDLAASEKR